MNQDHIRCFRTLAECLNYTQAATSLFITQPTLSRTISLLEKEIDAKLFIRNTHKVMLTAAGEIFYSRSKMILDSIESGVNDARHAGNRYTGRITLGYYCDHFNNDVVRIVRDFKGKYPDIDVCMRDYDPKGIIPAFEEGQIDVTIVPGAVRCPKAESIVIESRRECIVMPPNHRLCNQATVRLSDFKADNFVAMKHSALSPHYEAVTRVTALAGFVPKIVAEASFIGRSDACCLRLWRDDLAGHI